MELGPQGLLVHIAQVPDENATRGEDTRARMIGFPVDSVDFRKSNLVSWSTDWSAPVGPKEDGASKARGWSALGDECPEFPASDGRAQ